MLWTERNGEKKVGKMVALPDLAQKEAETGLNLEVGGRRFVEPLSLRTKKSEKYLNWRANYSLHDSGCLVDKSAIETLAGGGSLSLAKEKRKILKFILTRKGITVSMNKIRKSHRRY